LAVTAAVATPPSNAASVSVVYTIIPPGGSWNAADNGTYTVTLPANAVRDASGNGLAAGGGTFSVNAVRGGVTGVPDLVAAIAPTPALPAGVVAGTKGKLRLTITNQGDAAVAAPVSVLLRAVPTGSTTGGPVDVTTITRPLRLKAGQARSVAIPFAYPSVADGTYNLVATVDSANAVTEADETNNIATSAVPVAIALPVVDLVPTVGAPTGGAFTIGRRASVPVTIANNGNVPAGGTITIDLFASGDNLIDAGDFPLASVTRKIKVRNGASKVIRLSFVVPSGLAAGQYFVTTNVDSAGGIPESDETNNTAVSGSAFPVS
jgi:subtilase family serine protease